jgi:serine/threonine protein kinase/WD40 repeat protein/tetratricopeptide (TPR) repeat protein
MNELSTSRDPVEALAEEFLERTRRGERPTLEQYVQQYPELAADIHDLFPTLLAMEHLKPATDTSHSASPRPALALDPTLTQLGDYRIIREVGRGGMGIVYEAEQVSLGRHVALKVLPRQLLADAKIKQRFEREARAAARLHHTNIVPVYGVGEHDGTHYYAMQFIQGLGLDDVLTELKRMGSDSPGSGVPSGEVRISRRPDISAGDVARSLMTGRFIPAATENPAQLDNIAPTEAAGNTHRTAVQTATGRKSETIRLTSSTALLPGSSEAISGSRSSGQHNYWHSVAQIGNQVAQALAHAHDQGVLHRDIKPSNLMLDLRGTVWITDFGLAKDDDARNLTEQGDILGTLRYMPPEAFEGKTDARSDVYALGLTLYELLTYQPAFEETDRRKLIKLVTTAEPPRIDKLRPDVPRDLATIVQKAIDREPDGRYATAQAMADDLTRFIDDVPIQARRVSTAEQLSRWARRNRSTATLTATVIAVTLVGLIASTVLWRRTANALNLADQRARSEARAHAKTEVALKRTDDALKAVEQEQAKTRAALSDSYAAAGQAAGKQGEASQAILHFANAARVAGRGSDRQLINQTRVQMWAQQAPLPVSAILHEGHRIQQIVFHPQGQLVLMQDTRRADWSGQWHLWDLTTEARLPLPGGITEATAAAWNADATLLALGTAEGEVGIFRYPSGERTSTLAVSGPVTSITFHPAEQWLACSGAKEVTLVNLEDAEQKSVYPQGGAQRLVFHPAGDRLVIAQHIAAHYLAWRDKKLTRLATLSHRHRPWSMDTDWVTSSLVAPQFFAEGRGLLTFDANGAHGYNAATGRFVSDFLPRAILGGRLAATSDNFRTMAASPEGIYAAVSGTSFVRFFDLRTQQEIGAPLHHRELSYVHSLAFSPDGRTLASGGSDHTVRLWSVPSGNPLGAALEHTSNVQLVAWSPDGQLLATVQEGGLARFWKVPLSDAGGYRTDLDGSRSFATLARDGQVFMPTGMSKSSGSLVSTRLYETESGQAAGAALAPGGAIVDAALSADGKQAVLLTSNRIPEIRTVAGLLTIFSNPRARVSWWDTTTGQESHPSYRVLGEPRSVAYRPDGKQVAVLDAVGHVTTFDPATGKVQMEWQAHAAHPDNTHYINNGEILYSPDGSLLATYGNYEAAARLWNSEDGKLRLTLVHPASRKQKVHDVHFSPDMSLVATSCWADNTVRLWKLPSGEPAGPTLLQPDWPFMARFSPDMKLLVVACRDNQARLWDWRAGRTVAPGLRHDHEVHGAEFTPNGRWIVTTGDDKTARIWDLTGREVAPPFRTGGMAFSPLITPDGKRAIISGYLDALPVLDLTTLDEKTPLNDEELCAWAEVISGFEFYEGGGTSRMPVNDWLEQWQKLRHQRPSLVQVPVTTPDANLWRAAAAAEHANQWADAVAALDKLLEKQQGNRRLLLRRGRAQAALGNWTAAEKDFAIAARVEVYSGNPGDDNDTVFAWRYLTLALLVNGKTSVYPAICTAMAKNLELVSDPTQSAMIAWSCALGGKPQVELSQFVRRARAANQDDQSFIRTEALVDLRMGRGAKAVRDLESSFATSKTEGGILEWLILALAAHDLGEQEKAQAWLDRAEKQWAELQAAEGREWLWVQDKQIEILLREAQAKTKKASTNAEK